ncbi:peptidase [Thozetella sp. PMI_491]|nr:peptidase [Thozetella sp. PMI_491]
MATQSIPTYSPAERQRRWDLVRRFMAREDLDAIIVYGEHEDAGPAGFLFDAWLTNDRHGSIIVFPRNGDPYELVPFPHHLADHMEGSRNGDAIWIAPQNLRLGRSSKEIVNVLTELKLERGTIGVLGLEPIPPWHAEGIVPWGLWKNVLAQCPDAIFKPVALAFSEMMMPMGDEELTVLRHVASVGEEMAKAMIQAIRPGASEADVYQAGMAAAYGRGVVVPWMHLNTGPEAILMGPPRWTYRPQAPRLLQDSDRVASEIFCTISMCQTQHQLAVAIGKVHEDVDRAAAIARESYESGLKALQPNARFGEVADAMLKPVVEAGGWVKGPQIHSLHPLIAACGIPAPPDRLGDAYPVDLDHPTSFSNLVLKPGMAFAFEPSCGFGSHSVTLGGTVLVTKDGPVELTPFTAQLHRVAW